MTQCPNDHLMPNLPVLKRVIERSSFLCALHLITPVSSLE